MAQMVDELRAAGPGDSTGPVPPFVEGARRRRAGAFGWLCVEAPDADAALLLVDELKGFHAELAPGSGAGCEVHVELENKDDLRLADALRAVECWLETAGVRTAPVKLNGRCYLLESQAA